MGKAILNFIYKGDLIYDGLWAALKLLEENFEVNYNGKGKANFTLGWGAFNSEVDEYVRDQQGPKGLCIGGNTFPPKNEDDYDVLFYETEWYRPVIQHHKNIVHAFGVNTDIFKKEKRDKFFDWLGVGAFATWKRWDQVTFREGVRAVIGHYQLDNEEESSKIVKMLLKHGVGVFPQVGSEELAKFYQSARNVFIPANIIGGGERAVLEARACGCGVVVEKDNPKLAELLLCPIYDHRYYYKQLKKGIKSCLKE